MALSSGVATPCLLRHIGRFLWYNMHQEVRSPDSEVSIDSDKIPPSTLAGRGGGSTSWGEGGDASCSWGDGKQEAI